MNNHWLLIAIRKNTIADIRKELGNPTDMDDMQIQFAIEEAAAFFYKYRSQPYDLAYEGAVLYAKLMLARIRRMWPTPLTIANQHEAVTNVDEWQMRVRT